MKLELPLNLSFIKAINTLREMVYIEKVFFDTMSDFYLSDWNIFQQEHGRRIKEYIRERRLLERDIFEYDWIYKENTFIKTISVKPSKLISVFRASLNFKNELENVIDRFTLFEPFHPEQTKYDFRNFDIFNDIIWKEYEK